MQSYLRPKSETLVPFKQTPNCRQIIMLHFVNIGKFYGNKAIVDTRLICHFVIFKDAVIAAYPIYEWTKFLFQIYTSSRIDIVSLDNLTVSTTLEGKPVNNFGK